MNTIFCTRYDEELANAEVAGQDLRAKAGVPSPATRAGYNRGGGKVSTWK